MTLTNRVGTGNSKIQVGQGMDGTIVDKVGSTDKVKVEAEVKILCKVKGITDKIYTVHIVKRLGIP